MAGSRNRHRIVETWHTPILVEKFSAHTRPQRSKTTGPSLCTPACSNTCLHGHPNDLALDYQHSVFFPVASAV